MSEVTEMGLTAHVPFLVERARASSKLLSPDVAARIYESANGVPNRVQQLAFWAYGEAGETIDLESVDRALTKVMGLSVIDFTEAFGKVSPVQRRLL